ncbi:MAG: phytanoyl-CoA dioxygenase family protein, partial [Polyangiaceae bacterium]
TDARHSASRAPRMMRYLRRMDTQEALRRFRNEGYVILESLLSEGELAEIAAALAPFERARPMGRNNFEGELSQRVYSLAGKGTVFMKLAEHPRVLEIVDAMLAPNWLLSNLQSIRLHPGETAQPWHTDDGFYPIARPRPTLAVSTIWAIEDFTDENGATELTPGSHTWSDDRNPDEHPDAKTIRAVMPKGSVVLFDGALWHRGGANRSTTTRPRREPAILSAMAAAAGIAASHRAAGNRSTLFSARAIDARLQHSSAVSRTGGRHASPPFGRPGLSTPQDAGPCDRGCSSGEAESADVVSSRVVTH